MVDALRPCVEQAFGQRAACQLQVPAYVTLQFVVVGVVVDEREFYQFHVAVEVEIVVRIPHIGDAAAHAGSEILPCRSQHDDASAGHIFAAVVAHAFDDGCGAAVAHAETFAGASVDVHFAGCGTVEQGVACYDVFGGVEGALFGRCYDDVSARKSFAQIVVGVAFEP